MDELLNLLIELKSRENMEDFIVGILTPHELEQVIMRLKLVKMIKKGIPHHEIARRLGVGVATVTRGSRMLKKGHFDYVNE